ESAKTVYESELNIHCIGADVSWKVQLNDKQTEQILNLYNDKVSGYSANLVRQWKKHVWFNPVLHDPLAAYYAIDNSVCSMEKVWVEVETSDVLTKGFTLNMDNIYKYLKDKQDKPRVLCAKQVNAEKMIDIFLKHTFNN
ncbi:MAG: nucleoside hydrolase, partial [Bacilli bacterium]|nr:nucleoside hydrolase [Bacilli bacterium]